MYKNKTKNPPHVAAQAPNLSRFSEDSLPQSKIYLKKKNKIEASGWLYVRVFYHSQTAEKSLSVQLMEESWDPVNEVIINDQKLTQDIWNDKTSFTEAIMQGMHMAERATGLTPTLQDAADVVKGKTFLPETILDIFDEEIKRMRAVNGSGCTKANIQKHNVCRTHFVAMLSKEYNRKDVLLREISKKMVQTFMDYLRTDAACGHNTTIKHVQIFKKMFRIAVDNRWVDHNPFAGIKLGTKAVKKSVLSQEEVDRIANWKFTIKRIAQVRDLFIFSCYSGLAYLDLMGLQRDNMSDYLGRTWININRQKTDVSATIPLLAPARFILEKYQPSWRDLPGETKLFPLISNQRMNAYLKEVADICGVEKKLHFHLARHVFATTITLANNIPLESVSKMLGHSRIAMTQIYAKVVDQKISNDMDQLARSLEGKYENYGGDVRPNQPGVLKVLRKAK
jgi:site-specific recombinase XerD